MSALPPKADIRRHEYDVRFVPKADISSVLELQDLAARGQAQLQAPPQSKEVTQL